MDGTERIDASQAPELFALQTLDFTEDDVNETAVLLNQLDNEDYQELCQELLKEGRVILHNGVELLRSRIEHLALYERAHDVLQEALDKYALQEEVDFAEVLKKVGVEMRLQIPRVSPDGSSS
ncbi:MAG: hypothetical protein MHM6MM_009061 [Cercozoa sp. M6MM]